MPSKSKLVVLFKAEVSRVSFNLLVAVVVIVSDTLMNSPSSLRIPYSVTFSSDRYWHAEPIDLSYAILIDCSSISVSLRAALGFPLTFTVRTRGKKIIGTADGERDISTVFLIINLVTIIHTIIDTIF